MGSIQCTKCPSPLTPIATPIIGTDCTCTSSPKSLRHTIQLLGWHEGHQLHERIGHGSQGNSRLQPDTLCQEVIQPSIGIISISVGGINGKIVTYGQADTALDIAGCTDLLQPFEEKGMMRYNDVAALSDRLVKHRFGDVDTAEHPSSRLRRIADLQATVVITLLQGCRELLGDCFPYLIYRYH